MCNSLKMPREIEISHSIVKWLYREFEETKKIAPDISFKALRDAFLQGGVLEEGVAHVLNLKKLLETDSLIQCPKHCISQHFLEVSPSPSENEINQAKQILNELGITEIVATCDIYIDNPAKAKRDFWTFILGE